MNYDEEQWLPVKDFPNYMISSHGRLKSIYTHSSKILGCKKNKAVELCSKNKRKWFIFARLVLETFKGPPPLDKTFACHKDDNRFNNHIDNLYWGSSQDNADDRTRNGTYKTGGINISKTKKGKPLSPKLVAVLNKLRPHINAKISERTIGLIWITDGVKNTKIRNKSDLPDGWHFGVTRAPRKPVHFSN